MSDKLTVASSEMREEIVRRLGDPQLTLLNVLSSEAFEQGRIPGSINIPLLELQNRARRELPDSNREIIAYCGGPT